MEARADAEEVMPPRGEDDGQQQVADAINRCVAARNWRGVAALEREARELADALQATMPDDAAAIYITLGQAATELGTYREAIEHLEHAETICKEARSAYGASMACGSLGTCYEKKGEYEIASKEHRYR